MKDYNYRKERLGKICNVKGCLNTFASSVWYICEKHREDWGKDYEYKIDDPEKYYRDLKK
jgi:hypothetical protein